MSEHRVIPRPETNAVQYIFQVSFDTPRHNYSDISLED